MEKVSLSRKRPFFLEIPGQFFPPEKPKIDLLDLVVSTIYPVISSDDCICIFPLTLHGEWPALVSLLW